MTVVRHIIDPLTGLAILVTPDNPVSVGIDAPVGSLANIAGGGLWYSKTGSGNTAWSQLALGSSVTSVFGRTGAVVAAANDYTFAQLASKPTTIAGYGITDFNSLGDARWLQLTGGTLSGGLTLNGAALNAFLDAQVFATRPTTAGAANYWAWYDSLGTTRRAYIGLGAGSGSTADLYVNSDSGRVMIQANGGNSVAQFTTSGIAFNYALDVSGTVRSNSTYGLALGSISGVPRLQFNSFSPGSDYFSLHTASNGQGGLYCARAWFDGLANSFITVNSPSAGSYFQFNHSVAGADRWHVGIRASSNDFAWYSVGLAAEVLALGYSGGATLAGGDMVLSTAGKQFKDSWGTPMAPIHLSTVAPTTSDTSYADGTLWAKTT